MKKRQAGLALAAAALLCGGEAAAEWEYIGRGETVDIVAGISGEYYDGYDARGGALNNGGIIKKTNGDFSYNMTVGKEEARGGAIYNTGYIDTMDGAFQANEASGRYIAEGGAISNGGIINTINADFSGNKVVSDDSGGGSAFGGAIAHGMERSSATIGEIHSDFTDNSAVCIGRGCWAAGGAIASSGTINKISGTFRGNRAESDDGFSEGGAFWASHGSKFVNANFYDNAAIAGKYGEAAGGAIFAESLQVAADGGDSVFKGNYVAIGDEKKNNAIYVLGGDDLSPESRSDAASSLHAMPLGMVAVAGGHLEMSARNEGKVQMYDGIDGSNYNLNIIGDGTGEVALYSTVDNVENFSLAENSVMRLGKEAEINTYNYISNNGTMVVDLAVDAENETIQNGMITVENDVLGHTTVIVDVETPDTYEGALTAFLEAQNDNLDTASDFNVGRVVGSPYMWDAIRNAKGEEDGSTWYLALSGTENPEYLDPNPTPDPDPEPEPMPSNPIYAPEVPAYIGVQQAAVEQNRSIANSVARGLNPEKSLACDGESCGTAKLAPQKKAWVDATYESAQIDSPADMDADIKGATAGIDLYADGTHRAGIFGAYRNGKYDFSGKGDYYSNLGSQIKTDSYLGGAYYEFGRNDWKLLATLYAGKQDMDIKTDDRLAFASTDAMQYGASAELAKKFAAAQYLNVEPSLGLRYTMLDIDALTDNVGKTASFDTLQYLEAELGVKLEYLFCNNSCTNRLYAKPSVIQTFSSGGKTQITGIDGDIKSYENRTLGRMEVGGEFGITAALSGYAAAGYTFGDSYSSYDLNAGLNYAF